jgi:hypothetical protein
MTRLSMKRQPWFAQSLLIFMALAVGAPAVDKVATKPVLANRPVSFFASSEASALDTLLLFCQQEKIPLGVEYVDHALLMTPVEVKVSNSTVRQVMDKVLASLQGYRWEIMGHAIVVTHVSLDRTDSPNLLRLTLPQFKASESTLAEASNLLRMTIDRLLNPSVRGWAGSYSPDKTLRKVGPFNLRNLSVRGVLNNLVAEHGSAAWIVNVPPGHLDKLTPWGLWRMIEYEDPPRRYSAELEQLIREFKRREATSPVPDN